MVVAPYSLRLLFELPNIANLPDVWDCELKWFYFIHQILLNRSLFLFTIDIFLLKRQYIIAIYGNRTRTTFAGVFCTAGLVGLLCILLVGLIAWPHNPLWGLWSWFRAEGDHKSRAWIYIPVRGFPMNRRRDDRSELKSELIIQVEYKNINVIIVNNEAMVLKESLLNAGHYQEHILRIWVFDSH